MTQEGTSKLDKRRRILAVVKLIALAVILVGVPLYIYFFQHDLIERFSDIKELDRATLHRLVKRIDVDEQIDDDGNRDITIEIHFNFKEIPEVETFKKKKSA